MDFGLSDDQRLFQDSLRSFLADRLPTERVRSVMESASGHDPSLLAQLAGQGVTGILVDPEFGGSGLGLLDAAIAAEELGRAAAPLSFHGAAVVAPLLLAASARADVKKEWLSRIAAGKAVVAVATDLPLPEGGSLTASAGFVADAAVADAFLLVCGRGESTQVHLIASAEAGVRVEPLATIDDTRRLGDLHLGAVGVGDATTLDVADAAAVVDRALDAGRIALAADALGAAERGLEEAVKYALGREQFGRPIGSFQAVKHMCAEVFAEVEPVRALLWYAAFAWDEKRDDAPYVAALLKSHAAEVATEATTTCVQVFGGMGFTYECDMQLWFKRAGYDRQMYGTPVAMRERAATLSLGSFA